MSVCLSFFRIVVVKQTGDILPPLKNSSQCNVTLVDMVMRSILPTSQHLLSPEEVADAIETHLQTREEDIWPSWTVRPMHVQSMTKRVVDSFSVDQLIVSALTECHK